MYIWNFEVITKWSYHDVEDDGDSEDYTVADETFEKAWDKVKRLSLSKSRNFFDEEENKRQKPVSTQLTKVERGSWIDG